MPAVVRARLSAGLARHASVQVDDGRARNPAPALAAASVMVIEWPHAGDTNGDRMPSVFLLDPGVTPPAAQLTRGSTAWLPLDADPDDVAAAATAVLRGFTVIAPSVLPAQGTDRLRRERTASITAGDEPALTDRELDVLRALAEGLGNKHIAARLGISGSTVKYHLQAIFAKLGVRTRSEAVSHGLRRGVVPL